MVSSLTPPSIWSQMSPPCRRDELPGPVDLGQHQVHELLAAEAGLDGHQQHQVELGQQVSVRLIAVAGLKASPALAPAARIRRSARIGALAASA